MATGIWPTGVGDDWVRMDLSKYFRRRRAIGTAYMREPWGVGELTKSQTFLSRLLNVKRNF